MAAISTTNTVILKEPSQWKRWYDDIKSGIEKEIWDIINPEGEPVAAAARPNIPSFQQYSVNAQSYADLNMNQQKAFDNAMKHFDTYLRVFTAQQSKLATVREKIRMTVSDQKKVTLKADETTKQWLAKLLASTKPTDQETQLRAQLRYTKAIRLPRSMASIPAWIDEWEAAMAEGMDAGIPETTLQVTWLRHFCVATEQLAVPVSNHFQGLLTDRNATMLSYTDASERLRSWYTMKTYERQPNRIARGAAFEATFMGEAIEEEDEHIEQYQGRKRSRTNTTGSVGPKAPKKKQAKSDNWNPCPACDGRHELSKCWLAIEEIRLRDRIMSKAKLAKLAKRLKEDRELAEQIEKIKADLIDEA